MSEEDEDEEKMPPAFLAAEETVIDYLDTLPMEGEVDGLDRLGAIKALIHWLEFELRLAKLTPEEIKSMNSVRELSEAKRKRLDDAKNKDERDAIIEDYARAACFQEYAWAKYLNGNGEKPLVWTPSADLAA